MTRAYSAGLNEYISPVPPADDCGDRVFEQLREVVVQAGKIEREIFFERRDWKCNHSRELIAKGIWMHRLVRDVAQINHKVVGVRSGRAFL